MTVMIAHHPIDARAILAPMSGVTDLPFRRQARRFGAGLVVSEMVASEALAADRADMTRKMAGDAAVPPRIVQLAGREAKWMALGARIAADAGAQIIDINMGCPAKQVTKGLSGSALMRDLDHAMTLIEATVAAVELPVTLKMRLGWDEACLNAPDLAARAEAAGVCMVTVHGRTRQQFYKGEANWAAVKAVKDAVRIPVAVNGDIVDAASARRALAASGADFAMVGRAGVGRPWLVGEIAAALEGRVAVIAFDSKIEALAEALDESLGLYGERVGLKTMRKHFVGFLDAECATLSVPDRLEWRSRLCRETDPACVQTMLRSLQDLAGDVRAAA